MQAIVQWLNGNIVPVVVVLGVLGVEISPIKVSPIKLCLHLLGKELNKDVSNQIKDIKVDVDEINNKLIANQRRDILDFANSCRNGRKHTRDEFINIINDIDEYHSQINKRGLTNGYLDIESKYIIDTYKNLKSDDFL